MGTKLGQRGAKMCQRGTKMCQHSPKTGQHSPKMGQHSAKIGQHSSTSDTHSLKMGQHRSKMGQAGLDWPDLGAKMSVLERFLSCFCSARGKKHCKFCDQPLNPGAGPSGQPVSLPEAFGGNRRLQTAPPPAADLCMSTPVIFPLYSHYILASYSCPKFRHRKRGT